MAGSYPVVVKAAAGLPRSPWPKTSWMAVSATTAYVTCGLSRASRIQVVDSETVSRTSNVASGTSLTRRRTSAPRTGLVNVTLTGPDGQNLLSPQPRLTILRSP